MGVVACWATGTVLTASCISGAMAAAAAEALFANAERPGLDFWLVSLTRRNVAALLLLLLELLSEAWEKA